MSRICKIFEITRTFFSNSERPEQFLVQNAFLTCFWRNYLFIVFLLFLGSIIQKVNKTLDVVRDSFTYAEQTSAIFKFLVDQTQTPNSKVKVATMNYLRTLTQLMEPSEVLTMSNLSSGRN